MNQNIEDLKTFLDSKYLLYNSLSFIETDPISIPHLYSSKEDIEISGFLAATLAWGQRLTIINNTKKLMGWMDDAPLDFILNFTQQDLKLFQRFVHRTFNGIDCEYFLWSLKNIYQNYGSLENAFCGSFQPDELNVKNAIVTFRKVFFELDHPTRTQKHIANPEKKSSAKRLNMFLRWMVRTDDRGVDFGVWRKISPAQIICPLDVHSAKVARKLGLLKRNINDWSAAEELTNNLKLLDNTDPVKYDFALFGLGIFEGF